MTSLIHVDRFKLDLAGDYDTFAVALIGRYLAVQSAVGTPAPPFYLEQFANLARGHVLQFIAAAERRIDAWAAQVGNGVDMGGRSASIKEALSTIALGNVRDLGLRLRAGNDALMGLLNRPARTIGALLQQQLAQPVLKSLDGAGRSWNSDKLVRLLARDFAYQSFIDAQAYNLALGGDLARVAYEDSEHAHHGLIVSLSGAHASHPSLASIRKSIFHPNASAQLTHV